MAEKRAELHSLFPAEVDLQGRANKLTAEAVATFHKQERFDGSVKSLKMNDESRRNEETTSVKEVAVTPADKLRYVFDTIAQYYDAFVQKERTNQDARADVIIGGTVLLEGIPGPALLGLERRLKDIRDMCDAIPTLHPGIRWEATDTPGIRRAAHPEEKGKTEKDVRFKSVAKATPQHPEQVEKWNVDVPVGKYITEMTTSRLSSYEKSQMLGRIDELILAVKQARTRANSTPVVDIHIGEAIVSHILGDLV